MTTTLHAHISTASSDCDGPMYRDYVEALNDDEIAMHENSFQFAPHMCMGDHECPRENVNDFHDLTFKERVLGNHVSFSPLDCVQVTVTPQGFRMVEHTEEGYRSADVRWCEDADCDPNAASQRDVFAEAMNY